MSNLICLSKLDRTRAWDSESWWIKFFKNCLHLQITDICVNNAKNKHNGAESRFEINLNLFLPIFIIFTTFYIFWIVLVFINGKSRKCLLKYICLKIQIRLHMKSDTIAFAKNFEIDSLHIPPWSKLPIFVLKLWDLFDSKQMRF